MNLYAQVQRRRIHRKSSRSSLESLAGLIGKYLFLYKGSPQKLIDVAFFLSNEEITTQSYKALNKQGNMAQ